MKATKNRTYHAARQPNYKDYLYMRDSEIEKLHVETAWLSEATRKAIIKSLINKGGKHEKL